MKITKTARQNYILLTLATIFFLIAKSGFDELAKTGIDGLGMFPLVIGGLAFIGFAIGLVVRLWEME